MTDYDPRLVKLYDEENPDGPDHEFYRAVADQICARSALDIGCGIGTLTVTLSQPGRRLVGDDPSNAMIRYAAARPGGELVQWVHGDSSDIPHGEFDYAIMTGNVAQHILDPDWSRTLVDARRAPRGGGVLAFESRNPNGRAWASWATNTATVRSTNQGSLREWAEVHEQRPGLVVRTAHAVFEQSGEHVVARSTLAFRDHDLIEQQLRDAGLVVDAVYGNWSRTPYRRDAPIMVFQASKR